MFNKNHLHGIYTHANLHPEISALPLAMGKWVHRNGLTLINGEANVKAIEAFSCFYFQSKLPSHLHFQFELNIHCGAALLSHELEFWNEMQKE